MKTLIYKNGQLILQNKARLSSRINESIEEYQRDGNKEMQQK